MMMITTFAAVMWNLLTQLSRLVGPLRSPHPLCTLDILFRQITTFIKVHVAFVFQLQTLLLLYFTKIYQLKGMELKNKGHMSFYECCNLTKKVYLMYTYTTSLLDASPQFDSLIYGGQPFKLAFHHRLLLCAAYCCQEIKEACKIERRHSTKAVN